MNFINYIKAFDDMRVFWIFYGIYRDISSLIWLFTLEDTVVYITIMLKLI